MSPKQAMEAVKQITRAGRIIFPDYKTVELALIFISQYGLKGDQIFDAYLVATALVNDVKEVASDNVKDLQIFPIKLFNPFS